MTEQTFVQSDLNTRVPTARLFVYVALVALVWTVFGQTLGHSFVGYDDQNYVYQNPTITSGLTIDGLEKAFTRTHARNWHPLTTISHMVDCQLFGLNPVGHHLVNVLLHTIAVLLLFSALQTMTGTLWRSGFVAAMFAIHPLRAESVAWISERKDALSGVFFMLTLIAYLHYVRRPSLRCYLYLIAAFICGLMSKPMLVTVPLILLLLDYWPLNRLNLVPRKTRLVQLVVEKIPLLILSAASGVATLVAQKSTVDYANQIRFPTRLANAMISYAVYARQLIWPAKLSPFYNYAGDTASTFDILVAVIFICAATALVVSLPKRCPYLLTGWGWYIVGLLPVIGLVQVGLQGHADRYTYLPEIGLLVAITWGLTDFIRSFTERREILVAAAVMVMAPLTWLGWAQATCWKDSQSLVAQALAADPNNELANYDVAKSLLASGHTDDAITHFQRILGILPTTADRHSHISPAIVHTFLGNAFAQENLFDRALTEYREAVALDPTFADAHSNLGAMLARQGDLSNAICEFEAALKIPPEDAADHIRLATILKKVGRNQLADFHYRRAAQLASESNEPFGGQAQRPVDPH